MKIYSFEHGKHLSLFLFISIYKFRARVNDEIVCIRESELNIKSSVKLVIHSITCEQKCKPLVIFDFVF